VGPGARRDRVHPAARDALGHRGENFLLFFGVALIVVVLALPKGIAGTLADRLGTARARRGAQEER
jgi:ABC-type branched-subunit amino acid transport system permease subunit